MDPGLLELLAAIRQGEDADECMTNDRLVERLGWSEIDVAESLAGARAQLLIWGLHAWGNPKPRFQELELTVQGRRLLDAGPSSEDVPTGEPARQQHASAEPDDVVAG